MFCKTCGTACKDDQNYCHNDGTNLSVFGNVAIEFHGKSFCPGCGTSSEKNGSYCPSCGRSNSNVVADNRVSPINIPEINMKNFDNSLIKNIMKDGFRKDYFFSDEFKIDIKNVGLSLILTFGIAFFISLIVKQMVESSIIDSLISDIFPSGSDAIDKFWNDKDTSLKDKIELFASIAPKIAGFVMAKQTESKISIDEELAKAYMESSNKVNSLFKQTEGNKTQAAELLGTSFRSLRYRMKKLEIDEDIC